MKGQPRKGTTTNYGTPIKRGQRHLALVRLLRENGKMSSTQLGRLVGVPDDTVKRDMKAMRAAGVPITVTIGPWGGYTLDDSYVIDHAVFDRSEVQRRQQLIPKWPRGKKRGPMTNELKAKLSAIKRGRPKAREHVKKVAAANKMMWDSMSEDERSTRLARIFQWISVSPTKIERLIEEQLVSFCVEYVSEVWVGSYRVDFLVEKRLVIECDGEYWHGVERAAYAAKRDAYLTKCGYIVVHIKGKEIYKDEQVAAWKALMVLVEGGDDGDYVGDGT